MRRLNKMNLSGFHRSQAKGQTYVSRWRLVDDASSDLAPVELHIPTHRVSRVAPQAPSGRNVLWGRHQSVP
ncbi:hypothetical protein TNCV_3514811 [Trichonephila clavipes]|nr:hypothetical protein TNCV_3514811 [Trichonephila clavipes]